MTTPSSKRTEAPHLRLGVNIDHVATLRNARGGAHPDPVLAAQLALKAGADGITIHLREDRRHILDEDVARLSSVLDAPVNLEIAATPEMQKIALRHLPHAVCLVPERREERTTEGGLDVASDENRLGDFIHPLREAGTRVSMFVEPSIPQLEACARIRAAVVELHTGSYCEACLRGDAAAAAELKRLRHGAATAHALGLEVHAGHGLSFETVGPVAAIEQVVELNIGHFLVGEAVFMGLERSIQTMRAHMDAARSQKAAP